MRIINHTLEHLIKNWVHSAILWPNEALGNVVANGGHDWTARLAGATMEIIVNA